MRRDELTSDSGFVDDVEAIVTDTYADITPLYSNPNTHSRLFTATLRGKRFILKSLKEEYAAHPNYRELLNKEFEIGYHLAHPNIAATLGIHHIEGIGMAIAIEYVDGITLSEALESGTITSNMARTILGEICDAMHYMHSLQVIHRDIKPENIMLTHNGSHVKIIDFGLADSDTHTIFKQPAGTRRYASPELIEGKKIDNRSDIYSLGVIIGMMLHSRRERAIARRCMSNSPEARYHDANDVKRELLRPSRKGVYIGAMIALIAVIAMAIIAYNIGKRSSVEHDDRESNEMALYSAALERIESIADGAYTTHYERLSGITSHEEYSIFIDDLWALYDHIDSVSHTILSTTIDTTSTNYPIYESMLEQNLEDKKLEYNTLNEAMINETLTRLYIPTLKEDNN